MSLFNLEGKVALITGSTKGIGKAIAQRMAEQGARVIISSRNQDACDAVAAELRDKGLEATGVACNINYQEQLENLVDAARVAYGAIDILVCNAALNPFFGPSQEIPDAAFDKVMQANIGSVHRLCKLVIPDMADAGGGAVIIVSSIGGLKGSESLGAYAISKAGMEAMGRSWAAESEQTNMKINILDPGGTRTAMRAEAYPGEKPESVPSPDEIAPAFIELLSPECAYHGERLLAREMLGL